MCNGSGEWRTAHCALRTAPHDRRFLSNTNQYQGIFLGGKVRPKPTADNFAVLVVPNVKVRIKDPTAQPPSESS